jgi:hypothetical protein
VKRARAAVLVCLAAAGLISPGCGKKGPPLAPFVRVPGRAMDLKARRTGSTVTLTFTVPSVNLDDTRPADLAKVEVFAYTAMAQNDVRDTRRMTLVASRPVRRPANPEAEGGKRGEGREPGERGRPPAPAGPIAPTRPAGPGVDQGDLVTVTETLDESMLKPLAPDVKTKASPKAAEPRAWFDAPPPPPLGGPAVVAEASRYYVVYGVSRRGNRGGASPRPPVPLTAVPAAPAEPELTMTEAGVAVKWSAPAGARRPYQEPADEGTLTATYRGMESAPVLSFVVYLAPPRPVPTPASPAPATPPAPAPNTSGPVLLTEKPITALTWVDTEAKFGIERCYDVRVVMVQGPATLESEPSPVACVTPVDTFPPPVPTGLAAVAGEGAVSLIWVGVASPDLAGYLVLRAETPGGTLTPLFDTPLKETTYRDASARPGVRYLYAVVAVDNASPGNRSAASNTVEETAR